MKQNTYDTKYPVVREIIVLIQFAKYLISDCIEKIRRQNGFENHCKPLQYTSW